MIRVEIAPSVMAEMLYDRQIASEAVADDRALLEHMEQTLPRFRVCASCVPDHATYAEVRKALDCLWRGEAPVRSAA